jgi:flagellar basal body-associated protein FliL
MTKKKINVIITIMVVFIVLFMAGSFAYENYLIKKQDQQYEQTLKDLDDKKQENSTGKTNQEA